MAAQMILALSIIVGIHEFGHLLTAKIFGMRVEQYFIGFPPKIWSFNYKGTEYGLGSIPLGGFVKISGIIDESMDTSHINKEPESWEFRSKPAWQRLVVMLGGIIFNVITGLIIFSMITFNSGETFLSKDEINKNGILALELGKFNIRVNAICPGSVKGSRMNRVIKAKAKILNQSIKSIEKDFVSMSSLKQWVYEEDIAKMCSFLISNDSLRVSGQVISVDGNTERMD